VVINAMRRSTCITLLNWWVVFTCHDFIFSFQALTSTFHEHIHFPTSKGFVLEPTFHEHISSAKSCYESIYIDRYIKDLDSHSTLESQRVISSWQNPPSLNGGKKHTDFPNIVNKALWLLNTSKSSAIAKLFIEWTH
jgi:hypothetical protein